MKELLSWLRRPKNKQNELPTTTHEGWITPTNSSLKQPRFSKLMLSAFMLCFAVIGAYFIWKSFAAPKPPPPPNQRPSIPKAWGTWTISGAPNFGPTIPDWYKGHFVNLNWGEIEPTPGNFVWTTLDSQLNHIPSGKSAMAMVLTGEGVPSWFNPNVRGHIAGIGIDMNNYVYPLYFDPANPHTPNPMYLTLFHRMVEAFLRHVHDYNQSHGGKIIGLGCPVGNSTDPHPYDPHDPNYFDKRHDGWGKFGDISFIPRSDWQTFEIGDSSRGIEGQLTYYVNKAKELSPDTPCLINANDNRTTADFALNNLPDAWLKLSRIGDRYDNNDEINDDAFYLSTKTRELYKGHAIRTRSEMDLTQCQAHDGANCRAGWFSAAPNWQMYWSQLWALDRGLDMHNQKPFDIANALFSNDFTFFSKYAGYKSPQDSPGAWIAFRDNLDAANTTRFPEPRYGLYQNGKNGNRYRAIEQDFFRYGVQRPTDTRDGTNFCKTSNKKCSDYYRQDLGSTDWWGLEDITNNTYAGNYSNWMSMADPNGTSQGLWRVGPTDQQFGRYARRFDHASGKDKFYLNIDDRFFGSGGLNGAYPVDIRVVYFDSGTGKFAVKYDDITHTGKIAVTVAKTNTNRWKRVRVTVNDGSFSNHLERGSDIILQNLDAENDTFHMVEIVRDN